MLISKTIFEDCKKRKKELNMGWIDYQKATDGVPNSWIERSTELLGVNATIVKFCKYSMEKWNELIISKHIQIDTGILQGDSLSLLLFCVALIPLTHELNKSRCGYQVHGSERKISHLRYMDDMKLMGKNEELRDEIRITITFNSDIKMEFRLENCVKFSAKKVRSKEMSM
jgi:hypothetical protein